MVNNQGAASVASFYFLFHLAVSKGRKLQSAKTAHGACCSHPPTQPARLRGHSQCQTDDTMRRDPCAMIHGPLTLIQRPVVPAFISPQPRGAGPDRKAQATTVHGPKIMRFFTAKGRRPDTQATPNENRTACHGTRCKNERNTAHRFSLVYGIFNIYSHFLTFLFYCIGWDFMGLFYLG